MGPAGRGGQQESERWKENEWETPRSPARCADHPPAHAAMLLRLIFTHGDKRKRDAADGTSSDIALVLPLDAEGRLAL